MKEWLKKMLKAKEEARTVLKEKGKNSANADEVRNIGIQVDELSKEIDEYKSQLDLIEAKELQEQRDNKEKSADSGRTAAVNGEIPGVVASSIAGQEKRAEDGKKAEERANLQELYEKRGKDLKERRPVTFTLDEMPEFRSVTIGGGTLVVPSHESNRLNPRFNEVSGLIDQVHSVPLPGGESYKKGFEISAGEGDYTLEEGNYADAEPTYGYVDIGKAKITAYTEMSDESIKLPNVNYQARVARDIGVALRKKITKQIIVGAGGANALTGIFNAPVVVIPTATDISVSAIDADTLDRIVFGYGGDEDVEGGAVLMLNKTDLAAFAAIRSTDGKKLYKIKKNGNTGTISSDDSFEVPFIINSACPALSVVSTVVGTYCMAYGMVKAYELPIFSAIEVEESRDFKFRTGQIAYRGTVWAGGNVAMYKGFVRVRKIAAV